jgi:hypothetical protein
MSKRPEESSKRPASKAPSKAPASSVPSSKMGASRTPAAVPSSRAPSGFQESHRPSMIQEEEEVRTYRPPASKAPSKISSQVPSSSRIGASKSGTAVPSSRAPSGFQISHLPPMVEGEEEDFGQPPAYATNAPPSGGSSIARTRLQRDNTDQMKTKLQRDHSTVPQSTRPSTSRVPASKAPLSSIQEQSYRLQSTLREASHVPPASSGMVSQLRNPEDFKMASKMPIFESMTPNEQQKQDEWARDFIGHIGICPQDNGWVRREGGYQCSKGGHGMTDKMIAEGTGKLFAFKLGSAYDWNDKESWKGPYIKDADNDGYFIPAPGILE